jgi:hypothetical protein
MSSSDNLSSIVAQKGDLYEMAAILANVVRKMLLVKGDIRLSSDPVINEKKVVQFRKRMRVDGLEKFGQRTLFSTVIFYMDKSRMEDQSAVGAMVVYIPLDYIARLMWLMEYGRIDEDDDAAVLDACGTIANLIAGGFVKELCGHGFIHLEMSHFENFINTAVDGIHFSPDQDKKYEIEFFIRNEKRIVVEITMGRIPRY